MGSLPDPGFVRWGEAAPFPASLGFGLPTRLPRGAPPAAQAEPGPGPTRVSFRPNPYLERLDPHRCLLREELTARVLWDALRRPTAGVEPTPQGGPRRDTAGCL